MPDRLPRPSPAHFEAARADVATEEAERDQPYDELERRALIDERAHELAAADRDESDRLFRPYRESKS